MGPLVFAYDGSLNGDWVAHYAVRFAANTAERALRLVHLRERRADPHIDGRVARIAAECRLMGVALQTDVLAREGETVADRLLGLAAPGGTWVMGTRAKPRLGALLRGTVTATILAARRHSVLAIRVMHPGVLGQPGRVLLALPGPTPVRAATPLFQLLGADLRRVHVLCVEEVSSLHMRLLTEAATEALLAKGRGNVAAVEAALRAALGPHAFELDGSAVVSDDSARDILQCAARLRMRLVCAPATESFRASRLLTADPIEHLLASSASDVALFRCVE